jgi:hypothetical protein
MSEFDRVRPRSPRPISKSTPVEHHDAEGKRALFSSTETTVPGIGSALVECSRCNERTVMGLGKALRACLPSLHLGIRIGHKDDVRTLTVGHRPYPTYMRCPACGRPSWVRLTIQV